MEREGFSILSIRSFLRALRCLAHCLKYLVLLCVFERIFFLKCLSEAIPFVLTLVSVLKSVDKENVFGSCF